MKVLIVVDMQNDFIDGALGTAEAEAIVLTVVEKIRGFHGNLICVTKDTHHDNYLDTQEGKLLPVSHCVQDMRGWFTCNQVSEAILAAAANGIMTRTFLKPTFGSVELGMYLANRNEDERITEVEIVGLCTDICVISNALLVKAFLPEAEITVDAACCAGVTPESHRNALEAMKMCQIKILNG